MAKQPEPSPGGVKYYIDVLKSNTCNCGSPKRPKMAFCRRCYRALPEDMRMWLYCPIGGGFDRAYDQARKHLDGVKPQ